MTSQVDTVSVSNGGSAGNIGVVDGTATQTETLAASVATVNVGTSTSTTSTSTMFPTTTVITTPITPTVVVKQLQPIRPYNGSTPWKNFPWAL